MTKSKFLILGILCALFVVTSCNKKDDPVVPTVNESLVLAQFLESTNSPLGKDYVNTDMPSIIKATDVQALNLTGQIYIIDIRKAADYALGHIENAVNVPLGDVLTHIQGMDLSSYTKVAIVCYSGQSAAFTTCLLRLMGYEKVFSMKWGMCSWHTDFATKWQNAVANGNTYATQFTPTPTPKAAIGSMPTLATGETTGAAILAARVAALFTEGYGAAAVSSQTVFDNLSTYYIVNYWPADRYADPGHIPGAMQYTPKDAMKTTTFLKTLPVNMPVALYCYTGQTSSFLAAYLRLLGYDAKSMLYGANTMIYDMLVAKGWTVFNNDQIMDYPYVL